MAEVVDVYYQVETSYQGANDWYAGRGQSESLANAKRQAESVPDGWDKRIVKVTVTHEVVA